MGRNILRAGAFALMLGIATSAHAYRMYGVPDCGQWVKENSPTHRAWLLGYLSGINGGINVATKRDPLAKTNSAQQIFVWMDNYCRANPLNSLETGALELMAELSKQ